MSDLDFDELDKAVSTLMGDVPKVEPPKADDVKTLSITSTLPDESRPSLAKLDSELSKVNNTAPTFVDKPVTAPAVSTPSLATRRGGRFMDVVHPSSDMKGVVKPTTSASRQGVTIEPAGVSSLDQTDEKSMSVMGGIKSIDTPAASDAESVSNDMSEPRNEHDIPKNDWPDPLDMSSYVKEPDTNNSAELPGADISATVPATDLIDDDSDMQPLASPFLPDAKVEKRPLGGAPVDEAKNDENQAEELGRTPAVGVVAADDTAIENAAEQLPVDPAIVERPLPPELQSDLMAIETDGGTIADLAKTPEKDEVSATGKPEEKTPDAIPSPAQDKKPLAETVAVASVVAPATTLAGPTSIPQQYHEEPTTSDQTNGAIYDTDSYHQPLAHPAKTKSGWLWIIWILLLLMVGGGGAVALYFLGII